MRSIMTRREAREAVLTLLYEKNSRPDEDEREVYENSLAVREVSDNEYIKNVYYGVTEHCDEIDEHIKESAHDWSVDRMSRVTLSILRLATYELYFERTIPVSVTINEAVELAKKYDIDSAPAFVNGILNKIAKDPEIKKDPVPRKNKK